jgi:hypothetical protein
LRAAGAIYCRVPHRRAEDQCRVDVQELMCRMAAVRLGVPVADRDVYIDVHATAWLPDRTGPGWLDLIAAIRAGQFSHVIVYGMEELRLRAPADLAFLLDLGHEHAVMLHDPCSDLGWDDPRAVAVVRGQLARVLQTTGRLGEAARAAHARDAAEGRAHGGGRRAYGYAPGMGALVDAEAQVVRKIFARFVAGDSVCAICADLNACAIPAALGGAWTVNRVARVIDAPRYAGFRVFRGEIVRDDQGRPVAADWQPCVSVQQWEQAQRLRREQRRARDLANRGPRDYLLTGLVECARCGRAMVGSTIGPYPTYACTGNSEALRQCGRHIAAGRLEAFAQERAIVMLEQWDGEIPLARSAIPVRAWQAGGSRSALHDGHRAVRVRPASALDGVVTGEGARFGWDGLTHARKVAVLGFLFAVIRIGAKTTARSVFDESRVEFVPYEPPSPTREPASR